MAMLLHERLAAKPRRRILRRFLRQKLGEQIGLRLEPLRIFIGPEQIDHLVAKDRDATRLEADDADAGANLRAQRLEYVLQHRSWPGRACRSRRAGARSRAALSGS